MQSRQTFMAAMGGIDPGEEGYGEYDEARRRPAQPPAFVGVRFQTRARAHCPSRRETSPWTGSEASFARRLAHGPSRPEGLSVVSLAASVEFTVVGVGWGKGRSQWGRGGFRALVPFFHPALARVQVSHATGS